MADIVRSQHNSPVLVHECVSYCASCWGRRFYWAAENKLVYCANADRVRVDVLEQHEFLTEFRHALIRICNSAKVTTPTNIAHITWHLQQREQDGGSSRWVFEHNISLGIALLIMTWFVWKVIWKWLQYYCLRLWIFIYFLFNSTHFILLLTEGSYVSATSFRCSL